MRIWAGFLTLIILAQYKAVSATNKESCWTQLIGSDREGAYHQIQEHHFPAPQKEVLPLSLKEITNALTIAQKKQLGHWSDGDYGPINHYLRTRKIPPYELVDLNQAVENIAEEYRLNLTDLRNQLKRGALFPLDPLKYFREGLADWSVERIDEHQWLLTGIDLKYFPQLLYPTKAIEPVEFEKYRLKSLKNKIALMRAAFSAIPAQAGIVYRYETSAHHERTGSQEYFDRLNGLKPGDMYVLKGFTSASRKRLDQFAKKSKDGHFQNNLVYEFIIKANAVRSIEAVSNEGGELEVLISDGARFQVLDVFNDDNYHLIVLSEISQ